MRRVTSVIWTEEGDKAIFHLSVSAGQRLTVQLYDQDRFLRDIVLPLSKMPTVLTISHPIGLAHYFYLKDGDDEVVIKKVREVGHPLNRLTSIIDSLTDGYVSFSRSALEQIDGILSNI